MSRQYFHSCPHHFRSSSQWRIPFEFKMPESRIDSWRVLSHSPVPMMMFTWLYFHRVGHVRQIFVRAIEINVVVVIAVEEIADLERAAQADEVADGVGVPEGDVGGVIRAETRAAHADTIGAGLAPREIEHIVHNHIFISD